MCEEIVSVSGVLDTLIHIRTWRYFSKPCFLSRMRVGSGSELVNGSLETSEERPRLSGSSNPTENEHTNPYI